MKKIVLLLALLLPSIAYADQAVVGQFSGLNNNLASNIIDDDQAQDLLNVDITPGGRSVKKRPGYGIYKALGTGQGIHGGHHFYNSGGSDVQLWGSSTSLYGITADATPVQIISSATLNATWDCADTQGSAYCVNTGRDLLLRTDGVSISSWMTAPLGTMIEVTPDRLVVAGVSGSRNTLYFSQQNTFNNFTVGINQTDPFNEVIAAPGATITHIRWGCQKLLWWKNSSFGYITGSDQFNLGVVTVSDTIGTVDNSSSIDPGGTVWFRGQDGHIYSYNCSALQKESIDITPLTQASGNRTANSWTQTSQSDFQAGASTPTGNISMTISPGDVIVGSFTAVDTSSTDFSQGSGVNIDTFTSPGSVMLTNELYDTFSDFNKWTGFSTADYPSNNMTASGGVSKNSSAGSGSIARSSSTLPLTDNFFVQMLLNQSNTAQQNDLCIITSSDQGYCLEQLSGGVVPRISKRTDVKTSAGASAVCNGGSVVSYPATLTMVKSSTGAFSFYVNGSISCTGNDTTYTTFTKAAMIINDGSGNSSIDNVQITHSSGSFTSRVFDTGLQYSHLIPSATWTSNSFTPTFVLQRSIDGTSGWTDVTTTTGSDVSIPNRYIRYISTFTLTAGATSQSSINDVSFISRSSGTYLSAVKNAPNLTSWDIFTANKQDNGGSHSFFIRSSTNSFSVTSPTPTWVAQTAGSLVSASTGTYFQFADTFTVTNATQTPTLNDFTINWFEGSASDKAYSIFFDNAIWWSLTYGAGQASNNRIFKYDLINKAWLVYDIGTGGFIQQGQYLYFGSTTTSANTYKFGSGTSDNGSQIQAYWKSKDFGGQDPWLENQYKNIDSIYRTNANQSLTVSYALNTSTTTTSYLVNLSSTTQGIIRNKKILPNGKIGGNINIKFGDTSDSSSWELLGLRIQYVPQPYRPTQ